MLSNVKKKDVPLIAISLAAIVFIAATLSLFPQQTAQAADSIFNGVTRLLGSTVQVLVLLALGLVLYLATSKYGNIRLGEGKVEYSTLSWLFMFICAGLGSSTLYWGVAEWAYYYQTPGLNIAPQSPKALEYSIPYSFFHWGVSAWATYTLASLIMAYHFHVRKNKGLSLSGIVSAITGVNPQGFWGRLVDLMFLIATVGALTISLVVTAATFTRGLSALTGLPDNFTVQAFVILLSGGIFCMSSWIGINNGLQRLSKMVGWGAFLLPLVVLLVGPTEFITNNVINAVGLTTQNFLQMSLFTDPLGDGAFTRNWTVFYWLWWISYTPGVAMFVTRVSRGRKIKEVIWGLLLGSTAGCWFFFGVMESYAMHQFISGQLNVPEILSTQGGETAVAGGAVKLFHLLTFRQCPDDGVLPPAAADNQNIHCLHLNSAPAPGPIGPAGARDRTHKRTTCSAHPIAHGTRPTEGGMPRRTMRREQTQGGHGADSPPSSPAGTVGGRVALSGAGRADRGEPDRLPDRAAFGGDYHRRGKGRRSGARRGSRSPR